MKKENKSKYAILGMLFDKPQSGYEILQFMKESTTHFWQESDASIYPMLKALERDGLVTSRSEFVGKRERKIFEITASGKKYFLTWMALPAEKENNRSELLLKLFFGATTTQEENIKQLVMRRGQAQETKRIFRRIAEQTLSQVSDEHPHKQFWSMTLRYGLKLAEAELEWLDECINILKNK